MLIEILMNKCQNCFTVEASEWFEIQCGAVYIRSIVPQTNLKHGNKKIYEPRNVYDVQPPFEIAQQSYALKWAFGELPLT